MVRPLLAACVLVAFVGPAVAQSRDDDYGRGDRDREWRPQHSYRDDRYRDRMTHRDHDGHHGEGRRRGSAFSLQSGNARIMVRCGDEPLRACIDAATTLMDKARQLPGSGDPSQASPQPSR